MTDESTKYLDFIFVRMEAEIREKIAKEIEGLYHDDRENTCRKDNCIPCMIVDSAVGIVRSKND
jgi:hypothetical protein